jgi:hypothetical protein
MGSTSRHSSESLSPGILGRLQLSLLVSLSIKIESKVEVALCYFEIPERMKKPCKRMIGISATCRRSVLVEYSSFFERQPAIDEIVLVHVNTASFKLKVRIEL